MSERRKAIGYLRVSTPGQVTNGLGLKRQERKIREVAERLQLEVVSIYEDVGTAGGPFSGYRRGDLQAALKVARVQDMPIIVSELSRLTREPSKVDDLILLDGVEIISSKTEETVSPTAIRKVIEQAHRSRKNISKGTVEGHARRKAKGEVSGHVETLQVARENSLLTRKERAGEIVSTLKRMYPKAKCSLDFMTPFELLIATMLSAQSTDARVNLVTKSLFRKYPGPESFAAASQVEMERDVRQTGFFRNKAKAVIAASKEIVGKHGGKVPQSMEELTALPGVGRKTANVVLSNAFRTPVGIVVDTHVTRVAGRLGLTATTIAEKIEQDLMKLIPPKEWTSFSHWLIEHGRTLCVARKPKCSQCRLNELCPSAEEPLL